MNIMKVLSESLKIFKKDKWIIVFSIIPVLIGLVIYTLIGTYLYTDLVGWGSDWISEKVAAESFGTFIVYLMVTVLTILYYFLISWTFTLIVSVVASPFNDILSSRVEKAYLGEEADSIGSSLSRIGSRLLSTVFNEVKKISFILTVTIIAFLLGFIPILTPVAMVLSAYLMSASFLDYSWSRHKISFAGCLNHLKSGFLVYAISGFLFLFLISIPVFNVFVIPLAVIYFTILFTQKIDKRVLDA
jgi:CysZ protein